MASLVAFAVGGNQLYFVTTDDGASDDTLLFLERGLAERNREMEGYAALKRHASDKVTTKAFIAQHFSVAEQATEFARATCVVAVHGAGLSNIVFCRPGTCVIEIFPANTNWSNPLSIYCDICRSLRLRYHAVRAEPHATNPSGSLSDDQMTKLVSWIETSVER